MSHVDDVPFEFEKDLHQNIDTFVEWRIPSSEMDGIQARCAMERNTSVKS